MSLLNFHYTKKGEILIENNSNSPGYIKAIRKKSVRCSLFFQLFALLLLTMVVYLGNSELILRFYCFFKGGNKLYMMVNM